jgi:hypothetical protein
MEQMRGGRLFTAVATAILVAVSLNGCRKTPTPEETARAFFDQVQAGQTMAAYDSAAFSFRAQQSLKFFETALKEQDLDAITAVTYGPVEIDEARTGAKLNAEFETKSGRKRTLVVSLAKESGDWRVLALRSARDSATGRIQARFSTLGLGVDFHEPVNRAPAPDETAAKEMAKDTLLLFDEAVGQKSFADFFVHCSLTWQEQLVTGAPQPGRPMTMLKPLSPAESAVGIARLDRAFRVFIEKQARISEIKNVEPKLDPVLVGTEGLLVLSGEYATQPYATVFQLKYIYELPKWKLFGIDVSLRHPQRPTGEARDAEKKPAP